MRRVLHYCDVWLGRTENWIYPQVTRLPGEWRSAVACRTRANTPEFPHAPVYSGAEMPRARQALDRIAHLLRWRQHPSSLTDALRAECPDVLHSHFGTSGWRNLPAVRRAGCRHVVTFYGGDASMVPHSMPWWRRRYRQLFAEVDLVLCEGPFLANSLVNLGCTREKARVFHFGIRTWEIPFQPRVWEPGMPLRVLMAASFRQKKGMPIGIQALDRLAAHHPVELELVGDAGSDAASQREKASIEDALRNLRHLRVVKRHGYVSKAALLEISARSHIFLCPSRTADDGDAEGGAPVVLLEMAAAGMIVVGSSHCDIPNQLRHQQTGLVAAEGSVESAAEALSWVATNPQRWAAICRAARADIEARFDARRQAVELADIYRHTLPPA